MDRGYELFCLSDPHFYDSPTTTRGDDVDFAIARRPVPKGWQRSELDDWLVYIPEGARLPAQGWKIHASSCLDNADDVLGTVYEYCVKRELSFKFIRSLQLLLLRNAKYADRGASGKFVTIYPAEEVQLESVLTELGELLEGQRGPYILSDLRWREGPLYVRYGGFAERYCLGASGELELAIVDGDGQLVPDRRGPTFSIPPWVTVPDCLAPDLAARAAVTMEGLPYRIDSPIHFSNGGGIYEGVDQRTEEKVVFKEARPYAGLATDGADAVARLTREREVLERLAGLDVVPALKDHFTLGDHHFLVLEHIEGTSLNTLLVERYPLTQEEINETVVADYTSWALGVCGLVERAVQLVHDRGVLIGDFHPSNVLVQEDGRVVLIDFEVAGDVNEGRRQTMADPGFMAPRRCTGFDIDRHALACLRLFMFLPLTNLFAVAPDKAEHLAAEIADLFPVPRDFVSHAARVITGEGSGPNERAANPALRRPSLQADSAGWQEARRSMGRSILASATPQRDDRLFPGDPKQFATGGLNIAYGAAGVLYALSVTGVPIDPTHEEWLVRRATRPVSGTRLGFYDGLHGVAYVLDHLGRRPDAMKVLDICADEVGDRWDRLGLDLHGGLAGIGLNLAHFAAATGEPALEEAVWKVADVVTGRLGEEDSVPEVSGGKHPYAGLIRGSSGPALLFLRLYEQTGDSALLDLAATALRQDLRRCIFRDDGSLEVTEGWRTMPYLADGSVGIGLVLDIYLRHREDERFADAAAAVRRASRAQFYIEPGLFYGRAGMILCLSQGCPPGTAANDPVVSNHIRQLAWHALSYKGDLAFPGEQLLRLSMDLATGTAGVLLAVGAALHDGPVNLPFLSPFREEAVTGQKSERP